MNCISIPNIVSGTKILPRRDCEDVAVRAHRSLLLPPGKAATWKSARSESTGNAERQWKDQQPLLPSVTLGLHAFTPLVLFCTRFAVAFSSYLHVPASDLPCSFSTVSIVIGLPSRKHCLAMRNFCVLGVLCLKVGSRVEGSRENCVI